MSKTATMTIAFPQGGTLPRAITGKGNTKVPPHEAVRVPSAYGKQLVGDRFAYEVQPKPAKSGRQRHAAVELAATLAELRKSADATTDLAEKSRLEDEIAELAAKLAELEA